MTLEPGDCRRRDELQLRIGDLKFLSTAKGKAVRQCLAFRSVSKAAERVNGSHVRANKRPGEALTADCLLYSLSYKRQSK